MFLSFLDFSLFVNLQNFVHVSWIHHLMGIYIDQIVDECINIIQVLEYDDYFENYEFPRN